MTTTNQEAAHRPPIAIDLGGRYRHKRTGGIYTAQAVGKMKSGDGEWEAAVVYHRDEDSATFVRDAAHFAQNFEPLGDAA